MANMERERDDIFQQLVLSDGKIFIKMHVLIAIFIWVYIEPHTLTKGN